MAYFIAIGVVGIIFNIFAFLNLRDYFFIRLTETIICFFLRVLNSLSITNNYIWLAEIFPSKIRGSASGIIMFFGRMSYAITPQITQFAINHELHPLFFMPIMTVLFSYFIFLLPETYDKKMKN